MSRDDIIIGNGIETWFFKKEEIVEVFIFGREDLVLKSNQKRVSVPTANYFASDEEAAEFVEELTAEIKKRFILGKAL